MPSQRPPQRLHLRRIDPARNMRRFYEMAVQHDLFGGVALICEWGRIGSPGRIRRVPLPDAAFADEALAAAALAARAHAKARRGYRPA